MFVNINARININGESAKEKICLQKTFTRMQANALKNHKRN